MTTPLQSWGGDGAATWHRSVFKTSRPPRPRPLPRWLSVPCPAEVRLSLDPALAGRRGINGAWWPYSRDAAAELPAMLGELSARAGRVSRVAVPVDAFSNIPHRLIAGGHTIRVAWFRSMNTDTINMTMAFRDNLTLLVVPPQASPAAGGGGAETGLGRPPHRAAAGNPGRRRHHIHLA